VLTKHKFRLFLADKLSGSSTNTLILGKFLRNSRISFFVLLKIFYFSSSKKSQNIFFIISSIINLFFLKDQKIRINFNILKGTILIWLDNLWKKKKFLRKKKKEQSWIIKNQKISLKHFFYKRLCFQLNFELRCFQQKMENSTKTLYSNNMKEIFLKNKRKNFSNFFFETGNNFLKKYNELSS
jgi:hypothetical protein